MKAGQKNLLFVVVIILSTIFFGVFDYPVIWNKAADKINKTFILELPHLNFPFKLGLDLQGGTHLLYEADISDVKGSVSEAMQGVRDVIERRVNMFGVAEPVVQVNKVGDRYRLIVELAGVKDISEAIKMIGETPSLVFWDQRNTDETKKILELQEKGDSDWTNQNAYFKPTALSGKYLKKADLDFDPTTYSPSVTLEFDDEGKKLFEQITEMNIGKPLAIYLDGNAISAPTVREKISGGKAQITGDFSVNDAKQLVRRLNAGALPIPIKLINQESVGASLGDLYLKQSLRAALIGLVAVAIFMVLKYALNGIIAVAALIVYSIIVLAIFKIIPVTLTLAGIAGFILSIGMAVDANILIFERMKEELRGGKSLGMALEDGFNRAWPSIRDSNASSLITCIILFWMGTSVIKGFALTLAIGILVSMFSAITISRNFLKLLIKR